MSLKIGSYSLPEKNLKIRESKKEKRKIHLKKALVYLFLVLISIAMVVPLLWMFSSAFKPKAEIFTIAASSTIVALFFCTLAAFGFAKYQFPAREFLFLFLIGTLIIPFHTTMIPLYVLYRKIGWIDKF